MINKRRFGFTHLECIITAGIIVLLMSTLLPAIQSARESARKSMCKNNLKQIGLGLHNYHDVYQSFPPGWVSRRQSGQGHPSSGWMAAMLPFVDQARLFNEIYDGKGTVYETKNQTLLKTPIPVYLCPVAGLENTNRIRGDWGASSYAGVYGASPIPRWTTSLADNSFWPGNVGMTRNQNIKVRGQDKPLLGSFHINSNVGFKHIVDGTSNTFLVGEMSILSGGAIWPGPRSNFHESDILADTSFASPINKSETGFSSHHAGGLQFLMADGSVQFVSTDIESLPFNEDPTKLGTYQRLGAINDMQRVDF